MGSLIPQDTTDEVCHYVFLHVPCRAAVSSAVPPCRRAACRAVQPPASGAG